MLYEPGEKYGKTDIVLQVEEETPINVYARWNHSGYNIAGPVRWMMGMQAARVFGWSNEVGFNFITANDMKRFYAVIGNYTAYLPWRHIFKFMGNYAFSKPTPTSFNVPDSYDATGKSYFVTGKYQIPFKRYETYVQDLSFGYEFRRTNNFYTFGIVSISNTKVDISQFYARYDGKKEDPYGINTFGVAAYYSPGDMTTYNKNSIFNTERPGAKSRYLYGKFDYNRIPTYIVVCLCGIVVLMI